MSDGESRGPVFAMPRKKAWKKGCDGELIANSPARRFGGSAGRQLTGLVAEAPEFDFRRSARSDHETKLERRDPKAGLMRKNRLSVPRKNGKKSRNGDGRCRGGGMR